MSWRKGKRTVPSPHQTECVLPRRVLLSESSIVEQRSSLKPFVKRIEAGSLQLTLEYTLLLVNRKGRKGGREVLPFE